jgi:hypothetical protein
MPISLISFSFRRKDLIWLICLLLLSAIAFAWNQDQGKPLSVTPFLALGIALANALTNAYFLSRRHSREIAYRARIEAQPLVELKAQLIEELTAGHEKLTSLRTEIDGLETQRLTLAQLASLDRPGVQSLLLALGTRRGLWFERCFGFVSGVVASLVASVIYELARR